MQIHIRLRHGFESVCLQFLRSLLTTMPRSWVLVIGGVIGRFVGRGLRFRWNTTLDNLKRAFPDRSAAELVSMATRSFSSVGQTLFELAWLPKIAPDGLRNITRIENPEVLRSAFDRGTGVIVLTAHYGSWEVLGQIPSLVLGIPGTLLVRGLSNPLIDRQIDGIRRMFGNRTVPSTLAVRELLQVLRSGGWILMAADQSAPRESISVPFFGREVPTYQGPAMLALKTGAQLVLGLARRASDGIYDIRFEQIVTNDLSLSSPDALTQLTARHARATELAMQSEPDQWMWMHRRWKHAESVIPETVL